MRSEDYYDAATLGGADALLRADLGRLAPGAKADITVFDLSAPDLGQVIDPIQTMMLAGGGRDFSTVIIDGRFVMQDGVIPGIDRGRRRGARAGAVRPAGRDNIRSAPSAIRRSRRSSPPRYPVARRAS